MRSWYQIFPALLLVGFVTSTVATAQTKAVQTMSGILLKLNHFPNDADKQALNRIVEDKVTTAQERVVAQALMNVQHRVSAQDKPKLEALLKDDSAPPSVKMLATVILNLNHTPTDAEKEKLKELAL